MHPFQPRWLYGIVISFCLVLAAPHAPAQVDALNSSLDTSIGPRSVSLGEATAAVHATPDEFTSNPATLAGVGGAWLEYAHRGMEWLDLPTMGYFSVAGGFSTPFGTFSVSYRRQNLGEFVRTSSAGTGLGKVTSYNYTAGMAWGYSLNPFFHVGVAIKTYNDVIDANGWQGPTDVFFLESKPAYVFDLGVLQDTGPLLVEGASYDNLTFGFVLQNLGSGIRQRNSPTEQEIFFNLPRYLRFGLAYQYSLGPNEQGSQIPLRLLVTGEYRSLLNAAGSPHDHHWGWGLELTGMEMLSVRLGGYFSPYNWVYGREDVVAIRLGVGVNFPLTRLAPGWWPVTIYGNYAAIPLNGNTYFGSGAGTANVFSVGVSYDAEVVR